MPRPSPPGRKVLPSAGVRERAPDRPAARPRPTEPSRRPAWTRPCSTREEARETAREHFEFFWSKLFGGVQRGTVARAAGDEGYLPEKHHEQLSDHVKDQIDFDFDEAIESGSITVGEPEHVVADIERQYEAVGGAGHLALTVHHGDAPHETTMRSLELFGDEVLPELRKLD